MWKPIAANRVRAGSGRSGRPRAGGGGLTLGPLGGEDDIAVMGIGWGGPTGACLERARDDDMSPGTSNGGRGGTRALAETPPRGRARPDGVRRR